MKRSYARINESSNRRSQMLRNTMRAQIREAEDDEDEDIEIEADETEMDGDTGAEEGDLGSNIVALVKQAVAEGLVTAADIEDAIAENDDADEDMDMDDAGEDDEEGSADDMMEESAKKNRARRIAEARARIKARSHFNESRAPRQARKIVRVR